MSRRNLTARALAAVIVCSPLVADAASVAPAQAPAQISSHSGVKITIEPKGFSQDAKTWDFAVTLETHTQDLDDDLAQSTTLLADGTLHRPLGWEGSVPGSHHRKGVLRFAAVKPLPQVVELQIRREGESTPRIFRWQTTK